MDEGEPCVASRSEPLILPVRSTGDPGGIAFPPHRRE
jgi:hypothetical protein